MKKNCLLVVFYWVNDWFRENREREKEECMFMKVVFNILIVNYY